jgi:hypothetical protein
VTLAVPHKLGTCLFLVFTIALSHSRAEHFALACSPLSLSLCLFFSVSFPLSLPFFPSVSPHMYLSSVSSPPSLLSVSSSRSVPFCLFPSVSLMSLLLRLSPLCLFTSVCSPQTLLLCLFPSVSSPLPLPLCLFAPVSPSDFSPLYLPLCLFPSVSSF